MASLQAPGRLELVRSLVNTVEPETEGEVLQANGTLREWCSGTGLCVGAAESELARLRAFREALRSVLEAHAGDEGADYWQALQPYTDAARYKISIGADGRPVLLPRGDGVDAAIAAIFAIAYDAVRDGTWRRLKACRQRSCRWAFYDRSKNASGAWCSMRVCGNRVKAQRRRARRKSA